VTSFVQPLAFGAEITAPGRARFRLWAPDARQVELLISAHPGEGRDPAQVGEGHGRYGHPMPPAGDGWFALEAEARPGDRYGFRIDGNLLVPDPAARAQAEGVHGPSVLVDPAAYAWKTPDWRGRPFAEAVIYELHVGLCGGFEGVAARLPELKDLGVTAVELMPIGEFPGARGWGYDGVLPYAPEGSYGPPEALKALIDRAHDLGLMMLLDVVYNHFGPDGAYLHAYARRFFREDKHTPWGGAMDFRQAPVRRYFIDNALYWLNEYRFDGLRLDAVHAYADEDFLKALGREIRTGVEPGRHVCLILENEANTSSILGGRPFDAQWNDDVHHALHVLLTGEHHGYYGDFADRPAERLARGLRDGFVYQGDPTRRGAPRGEPSADLPVTSFVDCLQNHDQAGNRALGERLTVLADPGELKAAVALLLLCPHVPMIFMGEEVGTRSPFLYFTDHGPELARAVREGRRREFADFPGFKDRKAREKIPDPNAPETFERSRPVPPDDAEAWRALYRRLLALRRDLIVPRLEGTRSLEAAATGARAVRAGWRLGDGAVLTLVLDLDGGALEGPGEPVFALGGRFAAWLEPNR
jgi:maltooligosyltrehalose trehalohydrolase